MSFTSALFVFLGLVIFNVLGIILYHRYRLRKEHKLKANLRSELGRDFSHDFHDEVGSHLAKIIGMAGSLRLKLDAPDQIQYLDKIIQSAQSMFSGFGALVWSIQSEPISCQDVHLEISDFGNKLFDASPISFKASIEKGVVRYMYNTSVRDVTLSVKELITNALKHSQAKHITVDFTVLQDTLHIKVSDDGSGFSLTKIQSSGGLVNLKKRSERSDFAYTIESSKGSTFSLSIPIEHV